MNKKKIIIILLSIVFGITVIISASILNKKSGDDIENNVTILNIITSEELQSNDGVDGRSCYVAIDKIVYEISQGNKWKDGQHIPSEGLAYCGRDLSGVIDQAPHGKSTLSIVTEIGTLEN